MPDPIKSSGNKAKANCLSWWRMCIIVAAKVDTRNGESPASPDVLSYSRLWFWPRKVCTAESSKNRSAEDRAQKCKHSLLAPCSFSSSELLEKIAALYLVLCLGFHTESRLRFSFREGSAREEVKCLSPDKTWKLETIFDLKSSCTSGARAFFVRDCRDGPRKVIRATCLRSRTVR